MSDESHYLKEELYKLFRDDSSSLDFLRRASLDGLWYWDLENPDHEWISPEVWHSLGIDPATKEHKCSEWQELIFPEDLDTALDNFNKHCEDPSHPYDQVVRYKHADGHTVWVRCRGIAIRDAAGKPIRLLGAHNDITSVKELEERHKKSLQALDETYANTRLALEESEAIFNLSPDAMLQVDASGYIIKANAEAVTMFGYSQDELTNMSVDRLVPDEFGRKHQQFRARYAANPSIRPMDNSRTTIEGRKKGGALFPVEIRLASVDTRFGQRIIASIRDVSELQGLVRSLTEKIRENEMLYEQNTTDPLTNAKNRRFFEDVIAKEFSNSKRHRNPLSLILLDIDHFKAVNDRHGHETGDKVLTTLSQTLQSSLRVGDTFARLGGEEFCMLLPYTSCVSAELLADRLREKVAGMKVVNGGPAPVSVTVSLGVAELTQQDQCPEDILKRADAALYEAKDSGRNKVMVA